MLGKVVSEEEFGSSLNVSGREGSLLVVSDEFRGLQSQLLEHVQNQRVNNFHSLLRDTDVVRDTLENLVDVKRERLEVFLVSSSGSFNWSHKYKKLKIFFKYSNSDLNNYWLIYIVQVLNSNMVFLRKCLKL